MILAIVTILLIGSGACSLIVFEHALRADALRFPCASPPIRGILKVYAFALACRAAELTARTIHGDASWWTPTMLAGSLAMALTHGSILWMLIKARLPLGVWPRIQRRLDFVQKVAQNANTPRAAVLAADGAPAHVILAADGAEVAAPPAASPQEVFGAPDGLPSKLHG